MQMMNKPIRIMIIDDHRTMLWGLEKLIHSASPAMEVVATARSCTEALAQIRIVVPDLVLLDLDLGGESGLDLLPALLSNMVSQVLILTGEREQLTLDSAVIHGARGILRKDAAADQVLKAIEKVHRGELWLDRETLGRVFGKFANPSSARTSDPEMQKISTLTEREKNVIHTIVEQNGASNKAIAQKLFISEHTLRNHLTSIYQKLGASNRLELYVYAMKHKLDTHPTESPPGDIRRERHIPVPVSPVERMLHTHGVQVSGAL